MILKLANTAGGEEFIAVENSNICKITGLQAKQNRLYPWKARIVKITYNNSSIYRLIKGANVSGGDCELGLKTQFQLNIPIGHDVDVTRVKNQWLGRYNYYNNHLDDSVRFGFRIAFWGLFMGGISILTSLAGIVITVFHK